MFLNIATDMYECNAVCDQVVCRQEKNPMIPCDSAIISAKKEDAAVIKNG